MMNHLEKLNHPIWNLFLQSPHSFLEVKGEWSLAKVTGTILKKGVHLDVEKSSKYYCLSKVVSDETHSFSNGYTFFGYKKHIKQWNYEDPIIITLTSLLNSHLHNIADNNMCIYPIIKAYNYPKFEMITLEYINSEEEYTKTLKFSLDETINEIDRTESLLEDSRSGYNYFGVEIDDGGKEFFSDDDDSRDKTIGKVLNHRIGKSGDLELLIKWKYLSYDESTWIDLIKIKDNIQVRLYMIEHSLY